ncbi:TIGR01459 family HAD-type hydrolase [soil metagenome]
MQDLSARYPVWLCDVWGVVHNGIRSFPAALTALASHRRNGGTVVLLTNAPRPAGMVEVFLTKLAVTREHFDLVVTSGDVTRDLIARHAGGRIHYLGPARDHGLIEGLGVEIGNAENSEIILCVGLRDDATETAEDYRGELARLRDRGLAMICANPDLVVRRGDRLIPCAGAIAFLYEEMGGTVIMAGKPFRPIYELAIRAVANLRGAPPAMRDLLAIGDGPDTDVKGAADFGVDILLIQGGISESDTGLAEFEREVKARIRGARIVRALPFLNWS